MNFKINAYSLQDIGRRNNQEDCFFPPLIDPCHYDETSREWSFYDGTAHIDDRLFIVCDGMGGHERGEQASQLVTTVMSQTLLNKASIEGMFNDDLLKDAVDAAIDALHAEEDSKEKRKMGTTMTVLKFHTDGATVGHIGDSRVYQFRPAQNGHPAKVLFRTIDHTVLNDVMATGNMSVLEARKSPYRHMLSRAMIADKHIRPDVQIDHISDIQPGDVFLLCSDGIYENLSDEQLCTLLCDPNYNEEQRVQLLLHETMDNQDNHTAYIVCIEDVLNVTPSEDNTLSPGTLLKSANYSYRIEKVLGQGAFGITYLVSTGITMSGGLGIIRSDVKLALKEFFMKNEMKREGSLVTGGDRKAPMFFREKFRLEAAKLAMLSHPNIVKVLEVFEANGTIYYAMEYMPDGSLGDYVREKNGLPEQEALSCIRQIGSALSYLHLNKMLHLDTKPGNVMRNKDTNTLKIIDFGLAKRYTEDGDAETSSTCGSGSIGYAPLEQINGTQMQYFSPQMDIYALGATYYRLLTNITPDSAIEVLNHGLNTLPLIKRKVSQQSIDAILAAMQPITTNRLRTIQEFLDMLPRIDDRTLFRPHKSPLQWMWWIIGFVILLLFIALLVYHLT